MVSNRDLNEYDEFISKKENPLRLFWRKTSPEVLIGVVGLFIVGYYYVSKINVNPYVVLVGIIAVIIFMINQMNKAKEKEPLPLQTIRILAVSVMERSIGFVYPRGTLVNPGEHARMLWEGEFGNYFHEWKWEVGIILTLPNGLKKEKRLMMNPYTGFCNGVVPAYSGYTGLEEKDVKIVIPTNEFNLAGKAAPKAQKTY